MFNLGPCVGTLKRKNHFVSVRTLKRKNHSISFRFVSQIRYADSERICKVLINESADKAILEANAGRFVTRIDERSPHWKALKDGLEDLWKEVVVGDGEDEDFGDFGDLMVGISECTLLTF